MDNKGCRKCGSTEAGQKEIATTGTGLSKLFDVQHNRFLVVYCKNCNIQSFIIKSLQLLGIYSIYFLEADPCFRA
ncbi:zinc ribbon domain-containing protein [Bacillus subtilis]|uniref:zinc ribbon domain-containing protein n=1 Tax=Bacillus subtilis TaxID=1423 RepID=UPI003C1B9667